MEPKQTNLLTPLDRVNEKIKIYQAAAYDARNEYIAGMITKQSFDAILGRLTKLNLVSDYISIAKPNKEILEKQALYLQAKIDARLDDKNYSAWFEHSGNPNKSLKFNISKYKRETGVNDLHEQLNFINLVLEFYE